MKKYNYQDAIEYFYKMMEDGRIESDKQQEMFELAIEALESKNKEPKCK